jgi:hypothetical protein
LATLLRFRQELYDSLGLRQDSLFELVDAALTAPHRSTLVRLSLTAAFRRLWSSTCDALADGSVDVTALRTLFTRTLVDSVVEGRPLWVIDGTNWPRPAARASADRTWEYRPLPGWPQNGVIPAWSYQWLVATPDVAGSWVLPLDVQRRGPTAKSATEVALEQIAAVRKAQRADAPRPVVTLDSGYDLETLAHSNVDADLLVRLAKKRVVYRAPEQRAGRGRPRLHGEPFRLADEATYGQPQYSSQLEHPAYGAATIDVWTDLHVAGAPNAPFSVIRVQVERLPNKHLPPRPLWLAWIGGPLPADLSVVWRWYLRRFTVEHAFRFFKQDAGLDYRPSPPCGCSRSLDLADCRCLLAVVVGPSTGQRRSHALGASPTRWFRHSRSGPAPLHRNIGPGGYSGPRTSQARKIPRTSQRPTSARSTPLSGGSPNSLASRLISQFLVQSSIH